MYISIIDRPSASEELTEGFGLVGRLAAELDGVAGRDRAAGAQLGELGR